LTTIAIDPGHGGKDPGAVGNGLKEKDLTLAISLKVAELLRAQKLNVIMTRTADTFVDLSPARTPKCDLSISVHVNAGGGQGLETWVSLFNQPAKSKQLGQAIQNNIRKLVPFRDRGVKTKANSKNNADYLYMLRSAKGVPVLIECGFIDNITDANILKNAANLNKIAEGIANGVFEYLGIKKEPEKVDIKGALKTKAFFEGREMAGYIIDGKTFVELRQLCEAAGFKVTWNENIFGTEVKR
jgi:N-acetylmuramoyl-L-alanine amidase